MIIGEQKAEMELRAGNIILNKVLRFQKLDKILYVELLDIKVYLVMRVPQFFLRMYLLQAA